MFLWSFWSRDQKTVNVISLFGEVARHMFCNFHSYTYIARLMFSKKSYLADCAQMALFQADHRRG